MKHATFVRLFLLLVTILVSGATANAQSTCTVSGTFKNPDLTPVNNFPVTLTRVENTAGQLISARSITVRTNSSGVASFTVPRESVIYVYAQAADFHSFGAKGKALRVPNSSSADLATMNSVASVPSEGVTVKANNSAFATLIGTIDFGSGIIVTESPSGEVNVSVDAANIPWGTQTAHTVLAAPTTNGTPAFRSITSAYISDFTTAVGTNISNIIAVGAGLNADYNPAGPTFTISLVGGSANIVAREVDGSPSVTAGTVEFAQNHGFIITDEGGGVARIALASVPWAQINTTGSSLSDITTRSHTQLTDIGTNTHAQIDTFIASATATPGNDKLVKSGGSGTIDDGWLSSNVTKLGTSIDLSGAEATGTIADARFPATLPAVSGANLTNLNATNLVSGTVGDGRLSSNVFFVDGTRTGSSSATTGNAFTFGSTTLTSGSLIRGIVPETNFDGRIIDVRNNAGTPEDVFVVSSSGMIEVGTIPYASITSKSVVNADVSSSAAIAYSKLNLSASIVNADVATGAAIDATKIGGGAISNTEFARLDGVTGDIQTQIDGKQPLHAALTSIAGLTTAADKMVYTTASDTYAVADLTSFARTLLDDANSSTARTTLGLAIGTDVQAFNTALSQIAGLADPNADTILFWDDSASAWKHLTLGTNLSITDTTLNASGGGGSGDVVANATRTSNRLTKWTDATNKEIGNALLSDDGTNVSLVSGKFLVPDGSSTAPSLAFSSANTTGFAQPFGNILGVLIAGTSRIGIESNVLTLDSGMTLRWTDGAGVFASTADFGINRLAAGVGRITNASTGAGSLVIGPSTASVGTSGVGVLAFGNGTAPGSSPADVSQLYAADVSAGDSRLHARYESMSGGSPIAVLGLAQTWSAAQTFGTANIGVAGSSTGTLTFANATGANTTKFQAGASAPDLTYVLPTDTPTNGEQLTAAISGSTVTLSWDAAGSGGGSGSPAGSGSELQHRVDGSTFGAVTGSSVSGGAITLAAAHTTSVDSATTNALVTAGSFNITSSGTPASELGPQLLFGVETTGTGSTGAAFTVGAIGVALDAADHATRAGRTGLYSNTAGSNTLVERIFVNGNGLSIRPIGTSAGDTGRIRLMDLAANGSDYVEHKVADDVTASYSVIWPGAAPTGATSYSTSNYVPSVTTGGVVSWVKAMEVFTVNSPLQLSGGQLDLLTVGAALGGTGQTSYTKGDILVASGGTTLVKLAVGTDGHVLTADSNEASGVKWASAGAASLPVSDSTSIVEDNGDGTKEVRIEASGITTGNIRVWTAPNANTTIPIISQVLTISGPTAARTYTLPDENVNIGTLEIRQNSQSTDYTLVITDSGKHIYHPSADTSARTWTIPANASVAFPVGTAITFVNDTSAGTITIAITTDTLVLAGAGSTGSRTLAAGGVATAVKVTSTRWIISGTGLT